MTGRHKKGSGGLTPEPKGQKLKIKRTNDFNISKSSSEKKCEPLEFLGVMIVLLLILIVNLIKMIARLQIQLNPALYLRDPQSSDLGHKIVKESIFMIDEIGFEAFTFKKLSIKIGSTEASIYRYFENKHRLLVYLISWYWSYVEYQINFETHNIAEPEEKLKIAIRQITNKLEDDDHFPGISENVLQRIVINESDKTYLIKNVDEINEEGVFTGYKSLCTIIASYMEEINPTFSFSQSLTSTCLEAAHQQLFFALHLPSLSDIKREEDIYEQNFEFLSTVIFNTLK